MLGALLKVGFNLRVGLKHDFARVAVDNDFIAILQFFGDIQATHHGGNAHGAEHDGSVSSQTAGLRDERNHLATRHRGHLAWREFVRHNNCWFTQPFKPVFFLAHEQA